MYFEKGRVVHAEFGHLRGEEAVYALFADEQGSFEFTVGLPPPEVTVETGTENLMLEAIRRLDEARRGLEDAAIAPSVIPTFAEDAPNAGSFTLQAKEVFVLRLVNGQRNLAQIADEAKLELEEVLTIAGRLVKVGALCVGSKRPRTARLVAQLTREHLGSGVAGIDPSILANWERVLGYSPDRVACRRPDGQVLFFRAQPSAGTGPYICFSRDTLFRANLAVNVALLVKPLSQS